MISFLRRSNLAWGILVGLLPWIGFASAPLLRLLSHKLVFLTCLLPMVSWLAAPLIAGYRSNGRGLLYGPIASAPTWITVIVMGWQAQQGSSWTYASAAAEWFPLLGLAMILFGALLRLLTDLASRKPKEQGDSKVVH